MGLSVDDGEEILIGDNDLALSGKTDDLLLLRDDSTFKSQRIDDHNRNTDLVNEDSSAYDESEGDEGLDTVRSTLFDQHLPTHRDQASVHSLGP